ncbi:MAG: hypothetical protein ACK5NT_12875 [Pyrinomonadaceae bacterium]
MVRIIIGIVVGFVLWSVLWVGSSELLKAFSQEYAERLTSMQFSTADLIFALIRSFFCTIIAGWIAVLAAREYSKTTLGLGVLLLAVGVLVQATNWNVFPVWYHLVFLLALVPLTLFGGKMAKPKST